MGKMIKLEFGCIIKTCSSYYDENHLNYLKIEYPNIKIFKDKIYLLYFNNRRRII